jgi:hypothetical protein
MRALLIDKTGVREVVVGTQWEKMQALLENRQPDKDNDHHLKSYYYYMGCSTITAAGELDAHHVCYADDEALLKLQDGDQVTRVDWYPQELVGKLLITGFDANSGDTRPATLSIPEVERRIIQTGELRHV